LSAPESGAAGAEVAVVVGGALTPAAAGTMTGMGDCPFVVTIDSATKINNSEKNREIVFIFF